MSWSTTLFPRLLDRVIKHHILTFSTSLVAASTIAGALLMWAVVPPTPAHMRMPTAPMSENGMRLQDMLDSVKNRDKTSQERLQDAAHAMYYFMMSQSPTPPPLPESRPTEGGP